MMLQSVMLTLCTPAPPVTTVHPDPCSPPLGLHHLPTPGMFQLPTALPLHTGCTPRSPRPTSYLSIILHGRVATEAAALALEGSRRASLGPELLP
ncbi:hypothetical protein Hamer_G022547 [Homarus americanus]|uniref:Uncharacterized protein n=1 Tax=Homarus americanus TaxID=6706 RepID=A0A8J5JF12_HOMAM|nr:hypothetical protein Hamer_G022547 [Homarus americanus]